MASMLSRARENFNRGHIYLRFPRLRASLAINSHVTSVERLELYRLAQRDGVGRIVEIGSYLGASATAFAAGLLQAGKADGRVVCVDTWQNDAMTEGRQDTLARFRVHTATCSRLLVPVQGWSHEVVGQVAAAVGAIDLLFIDGDHEWAGCSRDWDFYAPLLAPRAYVVLHDIGWAEGVQQLRDVIARKGLSEEKRLPNLWWGRMSA